MLTRRGVIGASGAAAALTRTARAAEPELQFDVSVCFDSATLLWVPLRIPGLPAGLMQRPLRRLDDGSLRSAVVQIPAGWNSGKPLKLAQRLQFFVLSGAMQLGSQTFGQNGYVLEHPDRVMSVFGSAGGAEVLLVCDGRPAFSPATRGTENEGAIIVLKVPSDDTTRLWDDPKTGATMSLLAIPPGWTSPGPEYHPCQEEIFCLTGDIAPDDIRKMTAGWFLWNPPYGVHGYHLHAVAGGTVLEWHDGRWEKLLYKG